jgi:hypothetical protein
MLSYGDTTDACTVLFAFDAALQEQVVARHRKIFAIKG